MLKTEQRNPRTTHIDKMSTIEMVRIINDENRRSVEAVEAALDSVAKAIDLVAAAFEKGGRLIYFGAGTSGRIAMMDATECPPTYGVDPGMVVPVMAGGEKAFLHAAENEEDQADCGENDLLALTPTANDVIMGISASGGAAYVEAAMRKAKSIGCKTLSLASNHPCKISELADVAIYTDTGAEVITGSTRMKAGNAQKFVLNMITTCAMVKTGKVYENMMVNLKPTNVKLKGRMCRIVADACGVSEEEALALLEEHGFVIREVLKAKGKI
ncbi:MAG: N-acetylmuramic acid 6-phosphate etherase [Clostridia bacterium]|nr:N-acetylmuramic acid 6-phosphate etherase [Clostridia bacterium]